MKEITTITLTRDTAKKLKILKIDTDANDMDEVVNYLLKELKREVKK